MAEEEEEVGVETSFEELAKRAEDTEEDDDDTVLDLAPGDDKTEALIEKVIPVLEQHRELAQILMKKEQA